VRLAVIAGQFGEELVGRHADRGDQISLGFDSAFELLSNIGGGAEQALATADIEKRLVQAQRLDKRREGTKNLPNLLADVRVMLHPDRQEDAVRAQLLRSRRGHGAVHAKLASFVGSGTNHAAPLDAADDDRFAAQGWIVTLFDGRVKGV